MPSARAEVAGKMRDESRNMKMERGMRRDMGNSFFFMEGGGGVWNEM